MAMYTHSQKSPYEFEKNYFFLKCKNDGVFQLQYFINKKYSDSHNILKDGQLIVY